MNGSSLLQGLVMIWPMPCTLIGLAVGYVPGLGDRTVVYHQGVIGIYGPRIARLLQKVPIQGGAAALTLGHCVLARDEETFRATFTHEWVHVRQYEWWGPFFLPAYGLNSLWQWLRGKDAYRDNTFERQARRYE
jgi:hypothetical protein